MVDNSALASFIASYGSLNGYGSTVLQTKKALDAHTSKHLPKHDRALFDDAVEGIKAAKKYGFSADGIIAINKSFTHSETEDPPWPGHLRTDKYHNSDDEVVIITDPRGTTNDAYWPPKTVTARDLDKIVDTFNTSKKTTKDGWRVFAQIAKLQPFQDGNKRTALIAANSAMNTWQAKNYLTLPFNGIDHAEFMVNLMRFYVAKTPADEEKALDNMIAIVPSDMEIQMNQPIDDSAIDAKTKNVKFFNNNPTLKLKFDGLDGRDQQL